MQIIYMDSYHGQKSVIIAGDRKAIQMLRNVFSLQDAPIGSLLMKIGHDEAKFKGGISELNVYTATYDDVISKDSKLEWFISDESIRFCLGLVDGLLSSSDSGHQYVYSRPINIQIVISKDEYPPENSLR